jgi:hypothetical protein
MWFRSLRCPEPVIAEGPLQASSYFKGKQGRQVRIILKKLSSEFAPILGDLGEAPVIRPNSPCRFGTPPHRGRSTQHSRLDVEVPGQRANVVRGAMQRSREINLAETGVVLRALPKNSAAGLV